MGWFWCSHFDLAGQGRILLGSQAVLLGQDGRSLQPRGLQQEFKDVPGDAIYEIGEERGLRKLAPLPAPSK